MNATKEDSAELVSYRIEKSMSPRSLAITLAIFFLLFAAFAWNKRPDLAIAFALLFVLNFICYLFLPNAYLRLVKAWSKLGSLMHSIVQPLFVGALFLFVFFPVGALMRIFGKNPLWLNGKKINSMWQKPSPSSNFKDQF